MKSTSEITLDELMADELDVYLRRNKEFGYDLEIDDENGNPLVREIGIHPYAIDSFADICRRFLNFYDRAVGI